MFFLGYSAKNLKILPKNDPLVDQVNVKLLLRAYYDLRFNKLSYYVK